MSSSRKPAGQTIQPQQPYSPRPVFWRSSTRQSEDVSVYQDRFNRPCRASPRLIATGDSSPYSRPSSSTRKNFDVDAIRPHPPQQTEGDGEGRHSKEKIAGSSRPQSGERSASGSVGGTTSKQLNMFGEGSAEGEGAATEEGITTVATTDGLHVNKEVVGSCIYCKAPIYAGEVEDAADHVEDSDALKQEGSMLQLSFGLLLHPACVDAWEEEQHAESTTGKQLFSVKAVMTASMGSFEAPPADASQGSVTSLSQASLDNHNSTSSHASKEDSQDKVRRYLRNANADRPIDAAFFGSNVQTHNYTAAEQDELYRQQQEEKRKHRQEAIQLRKERREKNRAENLAKSNNQEDQQGEQSVKPQEPATSGRQGSFKRTVPTGEESSNREGSNTFLGNVQEHGEIEEIEDGEDVQPVLWNTRYTTTNETLWSASHVEVIPHSLCY